MKYPNCIITGETKIQKNRFDIIQYAKPWQRVEQQPFIWQSMATGIDAFNILIILESALSGACIFKGRDGAYRDIQSVHGSYKQVMQTGEAIKLAGESMNELQISKAIWYFDAPVSNSGRLKTFLLDIAGEENYNWDTQHVITKPSPVKTSVL